MLFHPLVIDIHTPDRLLCLEPGPLKWSVIMLSVYVLCVVNDQPWRRFALCGIFSVVFCCETCMYWLPERLQDWVTFLVIGIHVPPGKALFLLLEVSCCGPGKYWNDMFLNSIAFHSAPCSENILGRYCCLLKIVPQTIFGKCISVILLKLLTVPQNLNIVSRTVNIEQNINSYGSGSCKSPQNCWERQNGNAELLLCRLGSKPWWWGLMPCWRRLSVIVGAVAIVRQASAVIAVRPDADNAMQSSHFIVISCQRRQRLGS